MHREAGCDVVGRLVQLRVDVRLCRRDQVDQQGEIVDCLMWYRLVKAIEGDGTVSVQLWPALEPDAKD